MKTDENNFYMKHVIILEKAINHPNKWHKLGGMVKAKKRRKDHFPGSRIPCGVVKRRDIITATLEQPNILVGKKIRSKFLRKM